MPSQPNNLDADTLSSYPVKLAESGSLPVGESALPSSSVGDNFSNALENETPLEGRRVRYVGAPNPVVLAPAERSPSQVRQISEPGFPAEPLRSQPIVDPVLPTPSMNNQAQEIIVPLLEERIVVERRRRKVGEVVIRKEIETRIVEVPIHRERLIVEQISPEYQQLAVVELGSAQVADSAAFAVDEETQRPSISGRFASADAAIQLLAAIAADPHTDLHNVQIKVVLKNVAQLALYQRLLAQYSAEIRH